MFANARMYSIDAAASAHWRTLLEWVVARADVEAEVIDYPPPQPLPALWRRDDAACVQMCGYPLLRAAPQPIPLAAAVPRGARYGGAAAYWSDVVVAADAPWQSMDDLIGRRMAFTSEESQSGYHAPRRLFADVAAAHGKAQLFAGVIGPLITPMNVVHAVVAGEADAGPLDSYAHDLLRSHAPELAARLRTVAQTMPTPMPPFVAAAGTPARTVAALRSALLDVATAPELERVRDALLIRGFAAVTADDYTVLDRLAREADALGYPRLK